MSVPICPNCGQPADRILDLPYGYWEWNEDEESFQLRTCSQRVDVAPWVHHGCLGELRDLHPQNDYRTARR